MVDTENGSANTELSESSPANKLTALRDMQNGNQTPNAKETGPIKVYGTKRPPPECQLSLPHHQSPTNTAVNGRLVYVRRKADSELSKSNTNNKPNCSQPKKVSEQNDRILQESQIKDSRVCDSEAAKPSVPTSQPDDSDNHRDVTAVTPVEYPKKTNELHWEERFCRLQNLLKILDQSVHDGYVKMLQSLNSVELSRLAVELEKRSIHLSVQEVKEMQRVRQLDVLGKYNTTQQQNQSEKK